MADFTFNAAKGRVVYYATLPGINDGIRVIPLESSGLPADDTLKDYATLATLLAGSANEQTTIGRKTLGSVTVTVNNTSNLVDVSGAALSWTATSGNDIGALVFCYAPDLATSADSDLIPLTKYDLATGTGGDINVTVGTWYRGT